MNSFAGKILGYLGGRLARNIYLWVVILYLLWDNRTEKHAYPPAVYNTSVLITTAVIFVATYFNNLLLIPKLLARRKRLLYFLSFSVALFAFSLVYILVLKSIITRYPEIEVHEISLITTPVSEDWSALSIIDEIGMFLFGFTLWFIVMTMAWYMNDYTKQRKLAEEARKKQTEAELHLLKNQVNPHFLFNTLNNLYGLALKKSDTAPDAILRLSSILRYLLYESDVEKVSFEKEREVIQAYIDLELLRLPGNENFKFEIRADNNYKIPPLLWLPILENAFKHATRVISGDYYIDFRFIITNNMITIYSKNNYKLAVNGDTKTAGGIGLDNFKKRLALLYPGKHLLETNSDEQFYIVSAQIDIA